MDIDDIYKYLRLSCELIQIIEKNIKDIEIINFYEAIREHSDPEIGVSDGYIKEDKIECEINSLNIFAELINRTHIMIDYIENGKRFTSAMVLYNNFEDAEFFDEVVEEWGIDFILIENEKNNSN